MTEVLRVPQDEIEVNEDNCFFEAVFQGKPFTGIAWSDEDGEYSEISYVDGTAQGRCFSLFANGAMSSEEWVEQGRTVKSTSWWPPGEIIWRRYAPGLTQYFYRDGTLGIERTPQYERLFYESGVLRQEQVFEAAGASYRYFGEDGKLAAEWRRVQDGLRWKEVDFVFQDAYIREHYGKLLEDRDFERCFRHWLGEPPKTSGFQWFARPGKEKNSMCKEDVFEILCRLIRSENLQVRYFAITLAGTYQVHEARPLLQEALSQEVCPPAVRRLDGNGMSYGWTIAEVARRALEKLRLP